MDIFQHIADLICYAEIHLGLAKTDEVYIRNLLLAALMLSDFESRETDVKAINALECPDTLLAPVTAFALSAGVLAPGHEERFEAGIMNLLSKRPGELSGEFERRRLKNPEEAGGFFYDYCVKNNYVRLSAILRNKHRLAEGTKGKLEVTINLTKPEKSNKETAAAVNAVNKSYPLCLICKENEGFVNEKTVRQNLRTIPVTVGGEEWFWQFSPYSYYNQHMIAINRRHTPMNVNAASIEKLFDFVDYMPHYFIGCNASLPRIGGSILVHDHFQGGYKALPMHVAQTRKKLYCSGYNADIGIADWYNNVLRICGTDRNAVLRLAVRVHEVWENYEDPQAGIIPFTGAEKHNSTSPVVRRDGSKYICDIIFRNNRTNEKYPDGIFHAHPQYHHIKSESIGLIEAQGLFILPGRLDRQLGEVAAYLTGEKSYSAQNLAPDMLMFREMIERLLKENVKKLSAEEAAAAIDSEMDRVCENILVNTAVFKTDEGFLKFLTTAGIYDHR